MGANSVNLSVQPRADRGESPYAGRRAALATKHGKQRALAWPFRRGAGLTLSVPDGLDTDLLGTFTGEIPRAGTPGEVVRRKARLGMAATNLELGLASEGSFGPHPVLPFLPSDYEVLAFVDDTEGFSVSEEFVTHETNYARVECSTLADTLTFAQRIGFPSHAIIIRPTATTDAALLRKGITRFDELERDFHAAVHLSPEQRVTVETDMRAHLNPTRMRVLRRLATKLVRRLRVRCPVCRCPGFGKVGAKPGLPCRACGEPTEMTWHEIQGCPRCPERRFYPRTDGETSASPQHCPACNP